MLQQTSDSSMASPPSYVEEAVTSRYRRLCQAASVVIGGSRGGFSCSQKRALHQEYQFGIKIPVSLTDVVSQSLSELSFVTLLDLGCGSGAEINRLLNAFPGKVRPIGIDARKPQALADQYVRLGNIDRLSSIEELKHNKFDLIVSRATFRHLVDPKKACIDAYQLLAINGTLWIDELLLTGLNQGEGENLLESLKKRGYVVSVDSIVGLSQTAVSLCGFQIQKNHKETLELPLKYCEKKPLSLESASYTIYQK